MPFGPRKRRRKKKKGKYSVTNGFSRIAGTNTGPPATSHFGLEGQDVTMTHLLQPARAHAHLHQRWGIRSFGSEIPQDAQIDPGPLASIFVIIFTKSKKKKRKKRKSLNRTR